MPVYHTFTIPPSLGGGDFVVREQLVGEAEDIMAAAGANARGAQQDLVRAALVAFRGAPVPSGAEGEAFWRKLPLRVGTLITMAYGKVNSTTDAEDRAFFASMKGSTEPPKVI